MLSLLKLFFSIAISRPVVFFGPSFSCPAFSCPAYSCPAISCLVISCLAISCPAISCPAILMVRHFHVLHFQSTPYDLNRCGFTVQPDMRSIEFSPTTTDARGRANLLRIELKASGQNILVSHTPYIMMMRWWYSYSNVIEHWLQQRSVNKSHSKRYRLIHVHRK